MIEVAKKVNLYRLRKDDETPPSQILFSSCRGIHSGNRLSIFYFPLKTSKKVTVKKQKLRSI